MSESISGGKIRPFFIAAVKEFKNHGRPCDISSENVCAIRPTYTDEQPEAMKTTLILNSVENGNSVYIVRAPYEVVRRIFADHGYEFVDDNVLKEATAAWKKKHPHAMGLG